MKKILISVAIIAGFCGTPAFSGESVTQAEAVKQPAVTTQKLKQNYVSVVKCDMSRLFSKDALALVFFDFNEDNINKLESLVLENINAKIKDDGIDKSQDIIMGFQVFKNVTKLFGPDVLFGMIPSENMLKHPDFLGVINVQVDNFDPGTIQSFIGKKYDFKTETIDGVTLYYTELKHDKVVFAQFKKYFLISNSTNAIKNAITEYNNNNPGVLSNDVARKTISYLPENSLMAVLVNNQSIAKVYPQILKLADQEKKQCSKEDTNSSVDESAVTEENQSENEKAQQAEETSNSNERNVELKYTLTSDRFPLNEKLLIDYMNKYADANPYSTLSLDLQPDKVVINSYAMADFDFLSNVNPALKKSVENLYNANTVYQISESLPVDTFAYMMISNLGYVNELVYSLDIKNLQKSIVMGKVMFAAATGLDLDRDIFPIFRGQMTIAGTQYKKETTPVALLSYRPETLDTFGKLLEVADKMGQPINRQIKNIKGTDVVILDDEKMPFPVAYGKLKDNIIIGNYNLVKDLIKKSNKNKVFLSSNKAYEQYLSDSHVPQYMKLFVNIDDAVELISGMTSKSLSRAASNILESVYFDVTKPEKNVFSSELIFKFKPKLESKKD